MCRKSSHQSIINSDWNFEDMGIGGLDEEFSGIFRRAFASRLFPPEVIEQLRKYQPSICDSNFEIVKRDWFLFRC